jgi:hypothetical protein
MYTRVSKPCEREALDVYKDGIVVRKTGAWSFGSDALHWGFIRQSIQ